MHGGRDIAPLLLCQIIKDIRSTPKEFLPLDRPEWWEWELGFDSRIGDRMEERGFSEVELRAMLEDATGLSPARREAVPAAVEGGGSGVLLG